MTSGTFRSIEVSSIVVNRDERQRRALTDIPDLAESIKKNGLINPILITREGYVLIAGERRLAAIQSLGWTAVPAQFQDEIDPKVLHILELEENIRRVDLPWQDQVRAVAEYHESQKALDPEWNVDKSAEQLGVDRSDVYNKIAVAKELKANPEIAKMEKFSIAKNFVSRQLDRRQAESDKAFNTLLGKKPEAVVLCTDFLTWAPAYSGPPFNLIHCDFPYGVRMDKSGQAASARAGVGDYSDTEDVYWTLIQCLGQNLHSLAADSAHMVFWFSMKFYSPTIEALRAQGWTVDDFPLLWLKSDSVGIIPDPQRGGRRVYETAFLCSRGDRKIVRAVDNGVSLPRGEASHLSEKPEAVLRHFFKMLVDSSTTLLDPTAGSGTALRVADELGASAILGIERDQEFADKANAAFEKSKALRSIQV